MEHPQILKGVMFFSSSMFQFFPSAPAFELFDAWYGSRPTRADIKLIDFGPLGSWSDLRSENRGVLSHGVPPVIQVIGPLRIDTFCDLG